MSKVLQIIWDDKLGKAPPPARDSTARWNEWFTAANDVETLKTWEVVKQVFPDEERRCRWAQVLELNRLRRFYHKQETEHEHA